NARRVRSVAYWRARAARRRLLQARRRRRARSARARDRAALARGRRAGRLPRPARARAADRRRAAAQRQSGPARRRVGLRSRGLPAGDRRDDPSRPRLRLAGALRRGARLHLSNARRPSPDGAVAMLLRRTLKVVAALYLVVLIVSVMAYKAAFINLMFHNVFFGVYSVCVAGYIISRFYRSSPDAGLEPRIAIVMPGYNEEEAIGQSLSSLLALDYPTEKLQLIAVNDGSSDRTLQEMQRVADSAPGRVKVIDFPENRGKRAAMAAGIRDSDAEVIVFVDSDSVVVPDALRKLVQPFADSRVGAVCGHADVLNLRDNWLTRMQGVRYFVAFRVVKAAESVFHCVTCCSGCFSAYRREAILTRMEWWENQTFLGIESTFGDDRSLTNCVLRDWRVVYEKRAISHTIVPDTFRGFLKQQTRWKRSWTG